MVGVSLGLARLRTWLARQRTTQRDLARRLGIDAGQCSRMVNGRNLPKLTLAGDIERLTGGYVKASAWSMAHAGALPELPEHRGRKRRAV